MRLKTNILVDAYILSSITSKTWVDYHYYYVVTSRWWITAACLCKPHGRERAGKKKIWIPCSTSTLFIVIIHQRSCPLCYPKGFIIKVEVASEVRLTVRNSLDWRFVSLPLLATLQCIACVSVGAWCLYVLLVYNLRLLGPTNLFIDTASV